MTTSKDERIIEADQLFQIPATHPPALEAARANLRRLDALSQKYCDEGEPSKANALLAEIKAAEAEVTRLETEGRG